MSDSNYDENRIIGTYPVIVIGAGLGGLGAAGQLVLRGERVLILEKHNTPGGFATSFVRGRFEFEGALHVLSDYGSEDNQGNLYRFFNNLGVIPDKLSFKPVSELYRSIYYDGFDITLPFGVDEYTEKLIEFFPHEKQGIINFMDMCQKVQEGIEFIGSKGGRYDPGEVLQKHPWLPRISGLTFLELVQRYFEDEKLISVISQLWGYAGLPPRRVNAYIYIAMLMSFLKKKAVYPVGRSHALANALIASIKELGGDFKLNAPVNRILIESDKVWGVELINGDIYKCQAVISNVNPICTTMKMLPREIVPESYIKSIYAPEIGPSAFSVYLGLNASLEELNLDIHETFINKTANMDEAFKYFAKLEPPQYIVAACYNNVDKNISPPGTTEIVLTTLQMGKIWQNVPPDQYFHIKDRIANGMVDMLEEALCPNVRDYIETAEAATPLTYYRYSKNLEGAIYGYTQDVLNMPLLRLNSRGPFPGLYLVGAWTNFGGGFSTAILSGRLGAGMYLNDKVKGRI
jgi:phytoene dehydrogenase-like protein